MRTINFLMITLAAISIVSCTSNRYAATGPYESDEVYYTSDETYISDFALVDDEVAANHTPAQDNSETYSDDYYTGPNSGSNNNSDGITNNYYGNVYQSPWMGTPGYWNSGFGGYNFGTQWNNWGPSLQLGWSPWSGWYSTFNYNWGWNNGWNNGWHNPFWNNGWWNSPFYDPWGWNGWYGYQPFGWNPYWNSPFNYYYPGFYNPGMAWNNGGWFNDSDNNGFVFGPRNPIAVTNSVNSTYSDNIFYNGTKEEGQLTNTIQNGDTFKPIAPSVTNMPEAQTGVSSAKPQQTLSGGKPQTESLIQNGVISANDKPGVSNTSPFKPSNNSKPAQVGSVKPGPTYTIDRPSVSDVKPSTKPNSIGTTNQQVRTNKPAQPERIRLNEPIRTNEQVQPQREQRQPSVSQPRPAQPSRTVTRENNKPAVTQPQRRDPEISKPKTQENRQPSRQPSSVEPSREPSRSAPTRVAPSSPSTPSRSGGGGSTPRRK
jgi:hypothetical protein